MMKRCKAILSCIIFILLAMVLFSRITYLFRNTSNNNFRMMGLKEEGDLDVIYVGGSSTFVYWQPLRAWNDYGFTSYDYASSSLPADASEFYIKEALVTHSPELFVVELRAFNEFSSEFYEAALRNGADGMTWYSPNRWRYIKSYLSYHPVSGTTDTVSLYFDIAKYHSNITNLANKKSWAYSDNKESSEDKGFQWVDEYDYIYEPKDYLTDARGKLSEESTELLNRLLDFCDDRDLNVLFVISPYVVTKEEMAGFNSLRDIVEGRGYNCLNANEYYKEMNLDFGKDFYNNRHINCYGAEKYTRFLGGYIVENYNLEDHRADTDYDVWNVEFERFGSEESIHKERINILQREYSDNIIFGNEIARESDFVKWMKMVDDESYYLYIAQKGIELDSLSAFSQAIVKEWGLDIEAKNSCSVYNQYVIHSNADGKISDTIDYEYKNDIFYVIDNRKRQASIQINGEEESLMENGINVVVLDSRIGRVVDSVVLRDYNGEFYIKR